MPIEMGNAIARPTISIPATRSYVCDIEDEAADGGVEKIDAVGGVDVFAKEPQQIVLRMVMSNATANVVGTNMRL